MSDPVGPHASEQQRVLVCRHCGRPIAVAASTCPWCHRTIMVICAACKAYTDDQMATCTQCGAPLAPDRMESVTRLGRDRVLADLAQDQERAQLVASVVVAADLPDFFFTDGQGRRTVLAELLGPARDPQASAAGIIVAAYAYLTQKGYCSLDWEGEERRIRFAGLRDWDGQRNCLERELAEQAAYVSTTREATERALRNLMGFRAASVRLRAADGHSLTQVPERSAPAALNQTARLTVLPAHERKEGCRETYRLLATFIQADQVRARELAIETSRLLDWFAAQQPAL